MPELRDSQQRQPIIAISFTDPGFAQAVEPIRAVDPAVGLTVGDFKLIEKLGEGAMAVVYKAKQISTGRIVAVKTLRYSEADLAERFSREVSIHSKLRHPNIVEAIDCITLQGRAYFVMEYLNGLNLEDQLIKYGRCENAIALAHILGQICDALDVAHQQGIIHRDIKPENIILIDTPQGKQIKVLDFGVARIQEDLQRLTKTGVVLGSPAYMSPEQCMGMELDSRSDLYSLGVVAYELVTGYLPYTAETPVEMMESHCDPDQLPTPLAAYAPTIPALEQLQTVLYHALQTVVEERTSSINEFRRELDGWWQTAMVHEPDRPSPFKVKTNAPVVRVEKNKSVLNTSEVKSLGNLTGRQILQDVDEPKQLIPKNLQLPILIGTVAFVLMALIAFLSYFLLSTLEKQNQPAPSTEQQTR